MHPRRRNQLAALLPDRWAFVLRAQRRRAEVAPLLDFISADHVVLDIGANRGVYTYWFATTGAHVHAFEPLPNVAATLERVVPPTVTVHPVAIGDHSGTATLFIPVEDRESSIVPKESSGVEKIDVPVCTLDSFGLRPGFVKVDVEGAELQVLDGAEETLRDLPPLYIEIEQRHLRRHTVDDVFERITDMGYRCARSHSSSGFTPLEEFDLKRDQLDTLTDLRGGRYVHNFLFTAGAGN